MKNKIWILLASSFFLALNQTVYSSVGKGQAGVGLNTQGIHGRYFFSSRFAGEFKIQADGDIHIMGVRGLRYFQSKTKLPLFIGIEADLISFQTNQGNEKNSGSGAAAEFFVGGEYFFANRFSFQMDVGPAYIYVSEKYGDDSYSAKGLDVVVNFAFNYYFRLSK